MAIWFKETSAQELNMMGKNTMLEFLGIEFIEVGPDFLSASMPVNEKTKQPSGILHGGASLVLAETVASVAANGVIDRLKAYCVGLEINANHIRSVKEGLVTATTTAIHIGGTTQVWQITLYNEAGQITCTSRMTAAVIKRH